MSILRMQLWKSHLLSAMVVTLPLPVLLSSGRRRKSKSSTSKKEEKLLRQLREITQLMQEGRVEVASPEMEAEEVPYGADWEGTGQRSQCPSMIVV